MTTANFGPAELNIIRVRGDARPFSFRVVDSAGTAVDITGRVYTLTVNTEPEPADATNQQFQLVADVPTGTDGLMVFTPSAAAIALDPGEYFHDVEEVASLTNRTRWKGTFTVVQDINKD